MGDLLSRHPQWQREQFFIYFVNQLNLSQPKIENRTKIRPVPIYRFQRNELGNIPFFTQITHIY